MRLFFYKSIFVFISIFILYKVTVGQLIKDYENKINQTISKENIDKFKSKLRNEIKGSIKKDRILNEEDARLMGQFLKKIKREINNSQ
jgi:HD superfamily phosphodiesterase|tara:strand:- start:7208 stop:7471 length:264 start_codon:yes stop_codon:yes gene_type:complete